MEVLWRSCGGPVEVLWRSCGTPTCQVQLTTNVKLQVALVEPSTGPLSSVTSLQGSCWGQRRRNSVGRSHVMRVVVRMRHR